MKSSTKRSMVIVAGLVVTLGVSGAIFAGCSQTTEGEEGNQESRQVSERQTKSSPEPSKAVEDSKKNQDQTSPSALPTQMTKAPEPEKKTEQEKADEAEVDKALSDRKAVDTEITGEYKAGAVLTNKYSIIYNDQFQYIFELRLTNENGSKVINYYATKNAYDIASIGDTYKVTYGGDAEGNIAIRTISQ